MRREAASTGPAMALGAPLRKRLHEAGIRFDELDELPRAAPVAKL